MTIETVAGSERKANPFGFRPFRYLFAARLVNVIGNGMAPIALAFAVLDLGGSASELGIVVAARSVANVAVLLFGGVIADRLPRNVVLLGTSVIAALTQGVVAWLVLGHAASITALAALGVVNGAAAAVALPASSALIPQTVPASALRPANALLRLGLNGGTVLGAVGGAGLVAAIGPGWGLAIDALGFAVAGPLFLLVRGRPVAPREEATGILHELRVGWREFAGRSWVWVVVLQFALVNAAFTGAIAVLGPVVADASFGRASWGLVTAAETVGLVAGGFVALRWQPRRALLVGVLLTAFCGIPVALLAAAPLVPLLAAAFFVGGVALEQFGVAWDQSLQTHIPPDRLARVYSYDAVGSFAAIPLGELLVGPLADRIDVGAVLIGAAAIIGCACFGAALTPSIRRLTTDAAPAQTRA
jgi:MFS family permease